MRPESFEQLVEALGEDPAVYAHLKGIVETDPDFEKPTHAKCRKKIEDKLGGYRIETNTERAVRLGLVGQIDPSPIRD
jgi:hypothetical protein